MSMFLLVFSMFFVSAAPPFQSIGLAGEQRYIIEFPKISTAYYGNDYNFYAHVYQSNGTSLIVNNASDVECHLHGYTSNGLETYDSEMDYMGENIFYAYVPSSFFNFTGEGYYVLHCKDSKGIVGLVSNPFIVDKILSDKEFKINLNDRNDLIVLIIVLVISTILLFTDLRNLSGYGFMIAGLMLMFSSISFVVSILLLALGVFMSILTNK